MTAQAAAVAVIEASAGFAAKAGQLRYCAMVAQANADAMVAATSAEWKLFSSYMMFEITNAETELAGTTGATVEEWKLKTTIAASERKLAIEKQNEVMNAVSAALYA